MAIAVIAVGPAVAGCGSSGTPTAASTPSASAVGPALSIAACGAESDSDIATVSGISGIHQVSANPLRCRWSADPDAAVTFEWFRGSPIDARTPADPSARISALRIGAHVGRIFSASRSCEVVVDSGGGDFVDWREEAAQSVAAPPCSVVQQLAATTLTKAG